jgi:hypothetical protein
VEPAKHEADERSREKRREANNRKGGRQADKRSSSLSSDSLEDIGPMPAVRSVGRRARGRGSAGKEAMDSRFLDDYDPRQDGGAPTDASKDDFEVEVEKYRARQKLKRQGTQRLPSAGVNQAYTRVGQDDDTRVGQDDDTRNLNNLKWIKRGETREWDKGKFAEDGQADWAKAIFARISDC